MKNLEAVLFDLISFELGERVARHVPWSVDWECLWKMAIKQGVSSICLDCTDLKSGKTVRLRFLSL